MPDKWGYVFDVLEADAHFNYQNTTVCSTATRTFRSSSRSRDGDAESFTKLRIGLGRKYFINTGSVGQPRDGDPRASYVIYDVKAKEIELRRLPYDLKATQEDTKGRTAGTAGKRTGSRQVNGIDDPKGRTNRPKRRRNSMAYAISEKCTQCGNCVSVCPQEAIAKATIAM